METALWLCLLPIAWAVVSCFVSRGTITKKEAGLKTAIAVILTFIIYATMMWGNTRDTEILNGYVTGKEKNRVSCSHSYQCRCYTSCSGSGKTRSCSQKCSTCYEHLNDWDWDVSTTVGGVTINRVDRQGSEEPPRWTAVKIGEPAAIENSYTNYIKASPSSLFNTKLTEKDLETKAHLIPAYPSTYDYYKVNHVVDVGSGVKNLSEWDTNLDYLLTRLGAEKQINIVMVFVGGQGREYKEMLERAWLGGKKNDVVIIVGTSAGKNIEWVEAFTFGKTSGNALLAVQIRDQLQAFKTVDSPAAAVGAIGRMVRKDYHRKEMKDYEYLKNDGAPSEKQIGVLILLVMLVLGGLTYFFHRQDVFGDEGFKRFKRW